MMTKHLLHVALLSLVCAPVGVMAIEPETKTADLQKDVYAASPCTQKVMTQYKDMFGRPTFWAVAKNLLAFGGPLALMIVANRKLKKDKVAQRIKLKEQQDAQGGNPMAQLMMMMQGQGGFPGAEVRQPTTQQPKKEVKPEDMVESKKPYEKDILSTGMRRFWQAMSWLGGTLALVNGIGLGFNLWATITGDNKPAALHSGTNVRQEVLEVLKQTSKGNMEDKESAVLEWLARCRQDKNVKLIQNTIMDKARAKKNADGTLEKRWANEYAERAEEYCDRVHTYGAEHLRNNWFARFWRSWAGNDIPTRFAMLFKDFAQTKAPIKASSDSQGQSNA